MMRRATTLALGLAAAGAVSPTRATAQMQVALGQSIAGQLSSSDQRLQDGSVYDEYVFMGQAGQTIVVQLNSSAIDPLVLLWDQNGNELARDDDSGEGLNSLLTYRLPYTGRYRIIANTYGAGARFGAYTLVVGLQGMTIAGTGTPGTAQMRGMLTANQEVNGVLGAGDPRWNNKPFQVWGFPCRSGQSLQADVVSSWDNYAYLFDPSGTEVARNDDGGGSLNARIQHTCGATGTYRVVVSTFSTSSTAGGPYTLRVSSGAVAGGMAGNPGTGLLVGVIGMNQQVTGTISASDPTFNGKHYQAWGLQCEAGQAFQMDILSDWDNYAYVFDPSGAEAARDDDGGDAGFNARITHTCATAGTYRLVVTTYSSSTQSGAYTLQVRSAGVTVMNEPTPIGGDPEVPDPEARPGQTMPTPVTQGVTSITGRVPDPGEIGRLEAGTTMQGRLEAGDQQMNDGTWADVWQFQGTAGQLVTIELRSEEFDTYLQLLDAEGNRLAEDDDSLGDLDSRIVFRLPAAGMYQVVVNNFSDERRNGVYTITLR